MFRLEGKMQDKKKGIFFSADALIALAIILIVVLVAFPIFEYSTIKANINQDTIIVLTSLKVSEFATSNSIVDNWINSGIINDTHVSLLKQISIFYVENRTNAELLAQEVLNSLDTKDNMGIWYNNTLLASKNSTAYENATNVDVARQTISGISGLGGNSSTGFSARAYLTDIDNVRYTYFGGYIGDGNITVFLRDANFPAINTNVTIEGVISNDFDLYVNNVSVNNISAGSFNKSSSEFKPSNYNIGGLNFYIGSWNTYEYYQSLPELFYDMVEFRGNNLHIAGGFIKTEYSKSDLMSGPLRYYFPGIEGVINIYDGVYIPGNLSSMNVFLRINTNNYTSFLTIGNTTVYKGNTSGMQIITINNSQLLSYGLNYSQMSRTTLPLRIGMENVSYISNFSKPTDVISVTDLSGSMTALAYSRFKCVYTCMSGFFKVSEGSCLLNNSFIDSSTCNVIDNPCQISCGVGETLGYVGTNASKLDLAKEANNLLTDSLLNILNNNEGLVTFNKTGQLSHALSNDKVSLKSKINNWNGRGSTCICCGINKAITEFKNNSLASREKIMIVMSDGVTFERCYLPGATNASQDAIQAACNAHNATNNITVYAVGFGNQSETNINSPYFVDEDTLKNISQCGGGKYYFSNIIDLEKVYRQISQDIIQATYSEQTLNVTGNISTRLYPDSYIEFNYTKDPEAYGLLVSGENKFKDNLSGSFSVPNKSSIVETRVVSYSGPKWTDKVWINGNKTYDLSKYGSDYTKLGDPYAVNIPNSLVKINETNNIINLTIGISPTDFANGSEFNKIIYTIAREFAAYSDVVPNIDGCVWNIQFEDDTTAVIGSGSYPMNCFFNSTAVIYDNKDASQVATYNLFKQLDFNNNNKSDYKFSDQDLQIALNQISGIPFAESIEMQVRTWR